MSISGLIKNSAHEVNLYRDVLASETKVDFYGLSKLNVLEAVLASGGAQMNNRLNSSGAFVDVIVGICTTHEAYHNLFNTAVSYTYPDGPAIGTVGSRISATAAFDGWGYVRFKEQPYIEVVEGC